MLSLLASGFAAVTAFAKPQFLKVEEPVPDSYIIKLTPKHQGKDVIRHVEEVSSTLGHHFNSSSLRMYLNLAEHGFPAYGVSMTDYALDHILSLDAVEYVEQDMYVYAQQTSNLCQSSPSGNSQSGATWGIARTTNCKGRNGCSTSSICTGSNCPYYYNTNSDGSGVTVYILDTGVFCGNVDFTSKTTGSCTCGFSAFPQGCSQNSDGNGHGTHCASTAAGQTYGVAKGANIVAVKVLSDQGSGTNAGVINGVDYTAGDGAAKASVGSMSLGGGASSALDDAVNAATSSGTPIIVAAGNNNANACNYSPARATNVISVGSTTDTDFRSSFSNFGNCVDIFAPGSSITAAWIPGANDITTISGTSMACPHVTGIAAKMLSVNPSLTPSQVFSNILSAGTSGEVGNPGLGSPNLLAYGVCP